MRPEASMCAWCGTVLQPHDTAWAVKAQAVASLPEYEGEFVPLKLKSGRTITGYFVTSDSPAKRGGTDVVFATCGRGCAFALRAAVQEEMDSLGLIVS